MNDISTRSGEDNNDRPAAVPRRRYRRRRGTVLHLAQFSAHQRHGHARGDDRLRDLWPARAAQWTNAILCTHGYTASHHFAGRNPANGNQPGSWDGLIGPGKAIDTAKSFVV